jgi:hypothetical protein
MEPPRDFIKLESGRNRVEFWVQRFAVGHLWDNIATFLRMPRALTGH